MFLLDQPTVQINGETYFAELGTIENTFLGIEDHGIFTYMLDLNFAGSGQGFGHRTLVGTETIKSILSVAGASQWEDLKKRRVYALREESYGLIAGILSEDQKKAFIPEIGEGVLK